MKKLFQIATRPGGMVAWNPSGKGVLLIERVQFHALVRELLADVANEVQLTMFVFRICHHVKSGNEDENDRLQDLLSKRLHANMEQQWQKIVQYSFEGDEAQKHVDDFLEAYKYNLGHIAYGIGHLHDQSDEILNISLRRKPNPLQKLRGLLGDPYREINILRSEITRLEGTPFRFSISLRSGKTFTLRQNGVHP